MDPFTPVDIQAYGRGAFSTSEVRAVREIPLRILLGHRELVCLLCSGMEPVFLVVGHLYACGWIESAADILRLDLEETATGLTRVWNCALLRPAFNAWSSPPALAAR